MYSNVEKHYPFQEVLMKAKKNEEKSKKCNQCDYATSRAASLRTHLKTHSGEKSNKCNQCDFASWEKRLETAQKMADQRRQCTSLPEEVGEGN